MYIFVYAQERENKKNYVPFFFPSIPNASSCFSFSFQFFAKFSFGLNLDDSGEQAQRFLLVGAIYFRVGI